MGCQRDTLSHLTAEEMKNWTGAMEPSQPNFNPRANESLRESLPLSSSFDWTENGGNNYVTGVRNQGDVDLAGSSPLRLLLNRKR